MSFVDSFYSLTANLSNSDKGVYKKVNFKTAKHPNETFEHLYARILSFLHCFEEEIVFSRGLFAPEEPTIHIKNFNNETTTWNYVGLPSKKNIKKSLNNSTIENRSIYFYTKEQVNNFCYDMRGSKTNWLKEITFYLINPTFVEELFGLKSERMKWEVSICDSHIFINNQEGDSSVFVEEIDIWAAYQECLQSFEGSA